MYIYIYCMFYRNSINIPWLLYKCINSDLIDPVTLMVTFFQSAELSLIGLSLTPTMLRPLILIDTYKILALEGHHGNNSFYDKRNLWASARLCSGMTLVDGERTSCPEIVLDFLQWAATSLWDAHGVEQQTEHTHHHKTQVGHVQAVPVHQVCEDVCEHEGRQPADSHA